MIASSPFGGSGNITNTLKIGKYTYMLEGEIWQLGVS